MYEKFKKILSIAYRLKTPKTLVFLLNKIAISRKTEFSGTFSLYFLKSTLFWHVYQQKIYLNYFTKFTKRFYQNILNSCLLQANKLVMPYKNTGLFYRLQQNISIELHIV